MPSRMQVCVGLGFLLFAAATAAQRLPIKIYTSASGMPRNSARCMVPDASGMLWICTSEGLVRFDGYQFRVFGTESGLPSRSIFDLVPSKKGGYWVVSDAGVCRLPAGSKVGDICRPLEVEGPSGDFQPDCLVEAADGNTWVATMRAVFHVSSDGRKLEPTPLRVGREGGNLQALALAPDGTLLTGSEFAVYAWRPSGNSGGDPPRNITARFERFHGVSQILATTMGEVWVITAGRLYRMTGWGVAGPPDIEAADFRHGRSFERILRRRDGSLWMAGSGVSRIEFNGNGKLAETENFSSREGLPRNGVELLAEDRQGNLWGSAGAAGVFRIADAGFRVYSERDGLASSKIAALFESVRGDLCVITSVEGDGAPVNLAVKSGSRFTPVRYQRPRDLPAGWGWNQFGLQAHDGEWWLPTGAGLLRFSRSASPQELNGRTPVAVYNAASPLGEDQIFRIFEDSHGDIWIAGLTPNALVRWERKTGRFHRWTQREGWPENMVVSVIREAPSGTLWVGAFDEILRFRDGRFEVIPVLPSAQVAYVRDLHLDRAGRLWIATARYGLYRCDRPDDPHPMFRNYTTRDGLSSDSVRSITEDDAGFLYVGTVRSIDRIDPRAPGAHLIRHYTPADGIPDNEQNVAFRDHNGRLWFGTLDGLAEFDPSKARPVGAPDVYITRLRVRGEEIPLPWQGGRSLTADLAPDRNQFEIQYAGVDLGSVASLRYQYRLVGVDDEWSQPVDNVSFNYASLPAGNFRFEVRPVTADGQIGSLAVLHLSVQAVLWKRPWFIAVEVVMLALIATALFQYRVRSLMAMVRLRTRLASDLHDDIGASLTQISILTELARRDASPDVLEEVAGIAREMVADMSDIVWAVNPHHDRFDALAHRMRRFAADTLGDIELDFDASSLPADFSVLLEYRRPLYLVFKEATHNLARHSGATRAAIRFLVDADSLQLIVEDNGRGFDFQAPRQGEGISSIQRRMRDIGGAARWETVAGGGTRFTASVPLSPTGRLHKLGGMFVRRAR